MPIFEVAMTVVHSEVFKKAVVSGIAGFITGMCTELGHRCGKNIASEVDQDQPIGNEEELVTS